MNEELLEKARQLRAAGVPVAEIEKYLQSKMAPADDTVEVEASYPERLATTVLSAAQVVPGMKSFQALAGSLGSKFTDTPVSYSDARAGLEEQTDRMGGGRQLAAKVAASPMLVPVAGAARLSKLSPMIQGAAWGGADQALDIDPDRSLTEHVGRTSIGAGAGGVLGGAFGAGQWAVKNRKNLGPLVKGVGGALFPRLRQAGRVVKEIGKATAKTADDVAPTDGFLGNTIGNLAEAKPAPSAPMARRTQTPEELIERWTVPAEKPNTEGFLGNSLENVLEASQGQASASPVGRRGVTPVQLEDLLEQASGLAPKKSSHAPRHRTKAQFEHFAERMRQRGTEPPSDASIDDLPLEDLLKLSLEHSKKGGSLKSASDALKIVRQK